MASSTYNFTGSKALVVDSDQHAGELVANMLKGFGISADYVVKTAEEAKSVLESQKTIDMVICDSVLSDSLGTDFVRGLRQSGEQSRKFMPVIVLTGHTERNNVLAARDSGANNVIRKPVSPAALFDRLTWAVKNGRVFVEAQGYVGPDRRFRNLGPQNGEGLRSTDLPATVGEASEPNLSQNEIDSFMKPTKISID